MSETTEEHTLTRLSEDRVSYKVSLSERAQNACGQEGWSNVCWRLLHMGPKYIHNSGKERNVHKLMGLFVCCWSLRQCCVDVARHWGDMKCNAIKAKICALPIDAMAHARDESGQEHERFPVWRFFTCDAAHVTVGPAVTLQDSERRRDRKLSLL